MGSQQQRQQLSACSSEVQQLAGTVVGAVRLARFYVILCVILKCSTRYRGMYNCVDRFEPWQNIRQL